jgi:hypothetical protein
LALRTHELDPRPGMGSTHHHTIIITHDHARNRHGLGQS